MVDSKSISEQLKEARREQILEAAGRVFSRDGFHRSKMKDVAKEAGVSNGTVYNYFRSKEEVLKAIFHQLNESEQRASQFEGLKQSNSFRDVFQAYLSHRMDFLREHLELFRVILPELLSNVSLRESYQKEVLGPSFSLASEMLKQAMKDGVLRENDPELLARFLASGVLGFLMMGLLGDEVSLSRSNEFSAWMTGTLFEGIKPIAEGAEGS